MGTRERLAAMLPQFGLCIRGEGIELRVPDDDDLIALAEVAVGGIHDPDFMPFNNAWTDAPPDEVGRSVIVHGWAARTKLAPEQWTLPLVVVVAGAVVGVQDVRAERFGIQRTVSTGSWLGQRFQNRGIGTAMRAAVLHLAFEGLGALDAESDSRAGNVASARVSAKLGYRPDGIVIRCVRNERVVMDCWRLTREQWRERSRPPFEIIGLEPCLSALGATDRSDA